MSDIRPVGIGIIGAARVATYAMIAPARKEPRARLVAVAAREKERARAYAEAHGIAGVHDSYNALIADDEIELVYVATPPAFHARIALAAIAAGKHVLVEKPFAMDAAEAGAVARAAEAQDVNVFEAMHSRHHLLFVRLKQIVASGALGRLVTASARFDAPIPREPTEFRWRRELGGGALMDLGVYPLAWLRGLTGDEPSVTSARATTEEGVEGAFETTLSFPAGLKATVSASMIAREFAAQLLLEGEKGTLRVNNPLAPQMGHTLSLTLDGTTKSETVEGPSSFAAQLAAVCATIRDGSEFPLPPRDYVRSMAAIDHVRRAAGM